jgi:hypothetical protein
MGDRTNCQINVYSCPPEQVAAVLEIIEEHLGDNDYGEHTKRPHLLELGERFGAWEASCGSSDEIASAMEDRAPGAAFYVWEDPKYEWLGSANAYSPTLGSWGAECDADGQGVWTRGEILSLIDKHPSVEDLKRELGEPWLHLSDLLPEEGKRLLPDLSQFECPQCGDSWGQELSCTYCMEILAEREAKGRVVVDHVPDSDLVYVIRRPSAITFGCKTCSIHNDALRGRKVLVTTSGYWPTEAEVHAAHKGYGIGLGDHTPTDMEITAVSI